MISRHKAGHPEEYLGPQGAKRTALWSGLGSWGLMRWRTGAREECGEVRSQPGPSVWG